MKRNQKVLTVKKRRPVAIALVSAMLLALCAIPVQASAASPVFGYYDNTYFGRVEMIGTASTDVKADYAEAHTIVFVGQGTFSGSVYAQVEYGYAVGNNYYVRYSPWATSALDDIEVYAGVAAHLKGVTDVYQKGTHSCTISGTGTIYSTVGERGNHDYQYIS